MAITDNPLLSPRLAVPLGFIVLLPLFGRADEAIE
jgi:hypothetical protein